MTPEPIAVASDLLSETSDTSEGWTIHEPAAVAATVIRPTAIPPVLTRPAPAKLVPPLPSDVPTQILRAAQVRLPPARAAEPAIAQQQTVIRHAPAVQESTRIFQQP